MKNFLRRILNYFHFDLTKNLEYDRLTREVIKKTINHNSVCIDVGCHKGEILDLFIKYAPRATHYAFEPIPVYYEKLVKKYKDHCKIFPFALSDHAGRTEFQYVINAPAFSGIRQRKYNVETPEIEVLDVEVKKLDDIIPPDEKIDFIKIDVEGGEYQVLLGAKNILQKNKPVIIFECGIGATDFYETAPADIFLYLNNLGYKISLLKDFIRNGDSLPKDTFINIYNKNKEYYFVAF